MSDIQRYDRIGVMSERDYDGEWVRYADHVEALRQAGFEHARTLHAERENHYEQGQRDALAKALDAVGNATYGFRGTYHYIVDETVETALASLRALGGEE